MSSELAKAELEEMRLDLEAARSAAAKAEAERELAGVQASVAQQVRACRRLKMRLVLTGVSAGV